MNIHTPPINALATALTVYVHPACLSGTFFSSGFDIFTELSKDDIAEIMEFMDSLEMEDFSVMTRFFFPIFFLPLFSACLTNKI